MIQCGNQIRLATRRFQAQFPINAKRLFGLLLLLVLVAGPVRAEELDDRYIKISDLMDQGDTLRDGGKTDAARAKYQEAQIALANLKRTYPSWNVKVVSFRLEDLAGKIATLAETNSQVKLLDAGAEPREVLRLHPKPGDKQTTTMTMKIAMDMGQPMKIPAMKTPLEVTVKSVSANGDFSYETVMGETSVSEDGTPSPLAETIKTQLAGIRGLSTTGTMSNRGVSKSVEMKMPAGADPQTRQSMEQMKESLANVAAPLPEEAVGPGAKWEVKLPIKSQGMTISQTATYQLVSNKDDRLNLKSTILQQASNQKIQNPAMPGMKFDMKKMTGNATGTSSLDLAQLLPVLATVDSHSEISLEMNVGGQKQAMTMKTDVNMRMEEK